MADVEETRVDRSVEPPRVLRRQGGLARDGEGRVRQDFALGLAGREALRLATLFDPRTGAFALLDALTSRRLTRVSPQIEDALKEVLLQRAAGLGLELAPRGLTSSGVTNTALMSEEAVEGLTCRLVRWSAADGESGATWYAPGLGEVIRREKRGPREDYDYRLVNIRLGEPPASWFAVEEEP